MLYLLETKTGLVIYVVRDDKMMLFVWKAHLRANSIEALYVAGHRIFGTENLTIR